LHPLLFPLTLRLPPVPTLFPYTTLFRSLRGVSRPESPARGARGDRGPHASHRRGAAGEGTAQHPIHRSVGGLGPPAPDRRDPGLDRKSTRLNSSHVSISYAVFCLKKKK